MEDEELNRKLDGIVELISNVAKHLDGEMARLRAEQAETKTQLEQLDAKVERVETTLLTEFHKSASPMEARMRTHTAAMRVIDLELESLDDRVKKLEGGKQQGTPPS